MPIKQDTLNNFGCTSSTSNAAETAHAVLRLNQKCVYYDKDITEQDNLHPDTGLVKGMNLTYESSENCPVNN